MGREWLVSLNVGLGRLGYRPQYGTGILASLNVGLGRLGYRPQYGTGMREIRSVWKKSQASNVFIS